MKCPFCAETIQDKARLCRYCGKNITRADILGFPSFYKNVLQLGGVSWDALFMDYSEYLYPGAGFEHLGSSMILSRVFNHGPDNEVLKELKVFLAAITERAEEIWHEESNPERQVLALLIKYLSTVKDYYPEDYPERISNLDLIMHTRGRLDGLVAACSKLDSELKYSFLNLFEKDKEACEERIAELTTNKKAHTEKESIPAPISKERIAVSDTATSGGLRKLIKSWFS